MPFEGYFVVWKMELIQVGMHGIKKAGLGYKSHEIYFACRSLKGSHEDLDKLTLGSAFHGEGLKFRLG